MPKVVSIIPSKNKRKHGVHTTQGTQVLLDNGEKLEGVHKVTLVAEVDKPWKAIIEVWPVNQVQIDALLEKVITNETPKTTNQTASDHT